MCSGQLSLVLFFRDGKRVVAYELWGEGLVWLIGAVVCLCAAPWVPLFYRWAVDGRVMCRCIIGPCQSAVTSEIVKALLVTSLTHVSSTVASTRLLPDRYFYLNCTAYSETDVTTSEASLLKFLMYVMILMIIVLQIYS